MTVWVSSTSSPDKESNVSASPNYPAPTDEATRSSRREKLHMQIERGRELSLIERRNQRRTERVIELRSKKSSLHHAGISPLPASRSQNDPLRVMADKVSGGSDTNW